MKKSFLSSIIALIVILLVSNDILAIPAFARKYNMSCQTCHQPFPRLKAFGDEFAGNGFVLSDRDAPRYFVNTGDEELSLIRDFPIAVRLEGFLMYNNNQSKKGDFNVPYNLKLLSGGSIADHLAYYFYFFFSERGEVAGIEDAYIMYNNLFDIDLDIYVGQFQVSDPLFKRELRLTFEDYHVYKSQVGLSNITLTYDRGIMTTLGLETGTDIIFEVVNGTGIGEADLLKNFDNDKYKNFAGRISQEVAEFLRIGVFGYYGTEKLETSTGKTFKNKMWTAGPDLTLSYNDILELNIQYLRRNDDNPFGTNQKFKTQGSLGELIFMPEGDESSWYAVGLYNWVDSEQGSLDYRSASLNLGYLLRRNVRLVGEFTYNFTNKFGQPGIGFVAAF